MKRLPESKRELAGLRSSLLKRESTKRQLDRYGPESQAERYRFALDEYRMADTGREWLVARSGATVHRSPEFREMIRMAQDGLFDVLCVGYGDRFMQNLRETLNVIEGELHPAGVAVLFCEDDVLSSDPNDWEKLVAVATAADLWLRRHRRRVRQGHAAKRRLLKDPSGQPPFGFRRTGPRSTLETYADELPIVRRVFDLSALGYVDHEVGAEVGLSLDVVRNILTNPIYRGRLHDGTESQTGWIVDARKAQLVDAVRAKRTNRSSGRPETRATYFLPMLRCLACDAHLVGDDGRYRHLNVCDEFLTASPDEGTSAKRTKRLRTRSVDRSVYESLVPPLLQRVALKADEVRDGVAALESAAVAGPDPRALARIEELRKRAATAYVSDRDTTALELRMRQLDADEREIKDASQPVGMTIEAKRRYLGDLPAWWRDAEDRDRKALAESLFEAVYVLGPDTVVVVPTREGAEHGLRSAFGDGEVEMVGARGIAPRPPTFRSRCGSPSRPSRSIGSAAHEPHARTRRRTCYRPRGGRGRGSRGRRIGEGGGPPTWAVALDREAPPGKCALEGRGDDHGAARVDPGGPATCALICRLHSCRGRRRRHHQHLPASEDPERSV